MTLTDKYEALSALTDICLKRSGNGRWYVSWSVEIKEGGLLTSVTEWSDTIEGAINDLWLRVTTLPPNQCLVIDAMKPSRRQFRWNKYAWKEIPVVPRN